MEAGIHGFGRYSPTMQDFRKLRVWHLARAVSLQVIEALPVRTSRKVPGLRSQAIRAATSISGCLAEGCGRETRPDFLRFADMALTSYNELDAHLTLAVDAGVLAEARYAKLRPRLDQLRRMLVALMRTLQRRIAEEENDRRSKSGEPQGDDGTRR